jgi:hypothetical protein
MTNQHAKCFYANYRQNILEPESYEDGDVRFSASGVLECDKVIEDE